MATVYILYSQKIDHYYIGSCLDLKSRFEEHLKGKMDVAFTKRSDDWAMYFELPDLVLQLLKMFECLKKIITPTLDKIEK